MLDLTNLFDLFEEKGVSARLPQAISILIGNISDCKEGSEPSAEILTKIADYFNCSVDYLLGRTIIKVFT